MIRSLFVVLVIALLMTSVPAPAAGQTATPVTQPAACTVAPRTPEELEILLGTYVAPLPTPLAVQATPGGEWHIGIEALPDGTPVASAEMEAVVQAMFDCLAAGDMMRFLALFSDRYILDSRVLTGIGMSMATPDLRTPTPVTHNLPHPTRGLFHSRLLPDGRVAAVAPLSFVGLPELYVFVRENGRWRIDDRVPLASEYATAGVNGTTFTGSEFIVSGMSNVVIYGWGIEFGAEWTPVLDATPGGDPGLAVLTNGVSLIAVGIPGAGSGSDLADCVHPQPRDLASSLKGMGLRDVADALGQGLVPVAAADGAPLQGADENRAFAVYALVDPANGSVGADEARRVYIECRTMAEGAWILGVTHIMPAAAFDAETAKRAELLASLADVQAVQDPAN